LKSLPEDPDDLKGPVAPTGGKTKSLTLQTEDLQGQLAAHPKARFGPDSERLDPLAVDLQEDTGIAQAAQVETVRNFVPWRILLRHWEAFFEHDGELAFDGVPFAD
jgi:hypothetical protein